jgi:phage-related baseplate assembly protein
VERILIDVIAYRETLLRNGIQEAARQNLVRFATFPMLDFLGELVGVERLESQPAATTMRFTLISIQTFPIVIPEGTRIATKDGKYTFATESPLTIPAGAISGDVIAKAQDPGIAANGYLQGEVTTLLDPIGNLQGASNITTSSGGYDEESDEHYRDRIMLAPESFSVCGSRGGYRFHALTAHQSIVDVAIIRGEQGEILVYPLVESGDPSPEILAAVETTLSDERVRPISDVVNVQSPIRMDFSIAANVTLFTSTDQALAASTITERLGTYNAWLKAALGRDIVPSQIIGAIAQVDGVYQVELVTPAFSVVPDNAYANCTGITVNVVGVTDG